MRNFALGLLALAAATVAVPAQAQFYQCVAYAREVTGVAIRGNANTWWGQAEGRYDRGNAPAPGAILAFRSSRGMPAGHVAVVARVLSPREVLLDHANWSHPGGVERGVRAVDVSAAGDWSEVRVWYASVGDLGRRVNPTYGFIYPGRATPMAAPLAAPVTYASLPSVRASLVPSDVVELAAVGG